MVARVVELVGVVVAAPYSRPERNAAPLAARLGIVDRQGREPVELLVVRPFAAGRVGASPFAGLVAIAAAGRVLGQLAGR